MKNAVHFLRKIGILAVLVLLLLFSEETSDGIQKGVDICLSFVIPSTFLFLVCSEFLSSRCSSFLSFPCVARFLGIPHSQADIVFFSMIGGYPVGARILARRVKEGVLDTETASRMLAYCINPSPAFLFTAIGIRIFRSAEIGSALLIALLCAVAATAFFNRCKKYPETKNAKSVPIHADMAFLFVSAVKNSIYTTALICGCILLFSAVIPLLYDVCAYFLPQELLQYGYGFLEVCGGCARIAEGGFPQPLITAALFASFGGLCVFLQVAAVLHQSGVRMKRALLMRIPYTAAFTLCTWLLSHLLPQAAQESFAAFEGAVPESFSAAPVGIGFLIVMMLLLLFFSPHSATIKIKEHRAKGNVSI